MKNRSWNRAYAFANGYFWLPCVLCGQYSGGHEWLPESEACPSSVAVLDEPGQSRGICPDCTLAGKGQNHDQKVALWRARREGAPHPWLDAYDKFLDDLAARPTED